MVLSLASRVYQAPGELSVLKDHLDCRVSQDHLEPQDHQLVDGASIQLPVVIM